MAILSFWFCGMNRAKVVLNPAHQASRVVRRTKPSSRNAMGFFRAFGGVSRVMDDFAPADWAKLAQRAGTVRQSRAGSFGALNLVVRGNSNGYFQ
jgi:hypothetical protein